MQTPLIKYLEINVLVKGESPIKKKFLGSHIKCVPYIRFGTERQQPERVRDAAGPRPCSWDCCSSLRLCGAVAQPSRGGAEHC